MLQVALHGFEDNAINYVSNTNNQNHDGNDGAHVIEVTAHHEHLPQTKAQIEHLRGNQGPPSKSPALLQAGNDERETGGQEHMPEQLKSGGAEIASGHAVEFGPLFPAVVHSHRD